MIMSREQQLISLFTVLAVASLVFYALIFQRTVSQHRFVVEPFQPNVGIASQAVDVDRPGSSSTLPVRGRGNSTHPHLSGLRVAFLGDSLTRYMYMSLAAYLRSGRWVDDEDEPNIVEEKQFGDWNYYFNYTNNLFRPYEQCDCYRPPDQSWRSIENRYFNDPVGNNSIYFIQK
jgi:hypothetical protein